MSCTDSPERLARDIPPHCAGDPERKVTQERRCALFQRRRLLREQFGVDDGDEDATSPLKLQLLARRLRRLGEEEVRNCQEWLLAELFLAWRDRRKHATWKIRSGGHPDRGARPPHGPASALPSGGESGGGEGRSTGCPHGVRLPCATASARYVDERRSR